MKNSVLNLGLCLIAWCGILSGCVGGNNGTSSPAAVGTQSVKITSQEVFDALHPLNVDYERTPTVAELNQIGDYVVSNTNKPFYNVVILFAANINGTIESPVIYYNPQFQTLLQTESGLAAIHNLQSKGILVLMTYLGNHQPAGWSCLSDNTAESALANQMVSEINKYGLDGIDIDDEYSNCDISGTQLAPSIYNLVQAIKTNPAFSGKILTKALWNDSRFFTGNTNLANYLDGGWQMSYGNQSESTVVGALSAYSSAGMAESHLAIGIDPESTATGIYTNPNYAQSMVNAALNNGFGGVMVFGTNKFSSPDAAVSYLSRIAQTEYNSDVIYIGPTPAPQPTPTVSPTPSPVPSSSPLPMPTNVPAGAPQGPYLRGASAVNWDGSNLSVIYNGVTTPVLDYGAVCHAGAPVFSSNGILSCNSYTPLVQDVVYSETFTQGFWPNSCAVQNVSIDTSISGCANITTQSANGGICVSQIQAYCQNGDGVYQQTSINPNGNDCYNSTSGKWNIALNSNGQLYCPSSI